MKRAVLIRPHIHKKELPFQLHLFDEWVKSGIKYRGPSCPTWRWLFHLVNHFVSPKLLENRKEAHIVLVSGGAIKWGVWPDCMFYEIIPVIWDCWPLYFKRVFNIIEKYKVKTIITTSYQASCELKQRFPYINILNITEGINISLYEDGDILCRRKIDLLEYGRPTPHLKSLTIGDRYNHLKSPKKGRLFHTEREFVNALSNTKITITYPRCITDPETAGTIETLTQRYWENMLSRVVMVGKAPMELVKLIGYNPVIELDEINPDKQICMMLDNIADYQALVDKNRKVALIFSSWTDRVKNIEKFLIGEGYKI